MFNFYQGNKGSFSAVGIAELSCGRWHPYRPLRGDADVHKGLSRQREEHQLKFCLELLEIVRPCSTDYMYYMEKKKKMRKVGEEFNITQILKNTDIMIRGG